MGMTVVAVDLKEDLLAELPAALGDPGEKLRLPQARRDRQRGLHRAGRTTWPRSTGTLDVLVNNAGITRDGLLMRMDDADWDLVLRVNLTSAFIGTRAAAKHMVRQRSGSIVNMASYSGLEGNRGQANYAASKAGMLGLTKTTAKELAEQERPLQRGAPRASSRPR